MMERHVILILGMHRSGTSATTRVLNLLGAELGHDLMPPAEGNNSHGFWEHDGIVVIHEALLKALGRSWHDLRMLPPGWLDSEAAAIARRALVELLRVELDDTPLWAIKDPRLCRLVPLWRQVLGELGVSLHALLVVRHPQEVACSLLARDTIPLTQTYLSWIQHVADAESDTRDLSRAVLAYQDLLEDWEGAVTRVAQELQLTWPVQIDVARESIEHFLRPDARHHTVMADSGVPQLVRDAYYALLGKARGQSDWSRVQTWVNAFYPAAGVFDGGIDSIYAQVESEHAQQLILRAELDASRIQEVTSAAALTQAHDREVLMLKQRDDLGAQVDGLEAQVGDLGTQVNVLGAKASRGCREVALSRRRMEEGVMSRLRRRFARTEFRMLPTQQLEVIDPASRRWRVTGNDPIFACESENYPLPAGWYRVELDMLQHDGTSMDARFYPDYGIDLAQDPEGVDMPFGKIGQSVHSGIVRFTHPVFGLRFDPATMPCELSMRRLVVRRVSKLRAGLELIHAVWIASRGVPGARKTPLRRAIDKFREVGLRGFGNWLYASYATPKNHDVYATWLSNYDHSTTRDIQKASTQSSSFAFQPLISILVPCYNSDREWLRRCIESVRAQAYPCWELCMADDASPSADTMRLLNEYAKTDKRVKVMRRAVNGHISAASNSALDLATGEYVALLDHDDELHPLALFEMVKALQTHRDWKLIYSDEDKVDQHGRRYDPYMKPDWNYDLFLSQNCISHLGVYQRQLVLDVGGFREGYEGSQDWDLALRCVEKLKDDEIGHIPHVLYHWRAIPGSTAVGVDEKNYARTAAMKVITEHLKRIGADASVKEHENPRLKGQFHVSYGLPAKLPKVSLIIPTRDGLKLLQRCIDSILTLTDYDNYEIVIVDNQSSERETLEYLSQVVADPRVRVLVYDQPFNYSALNNYAADETSGELVGLVNNDIEVISPGWLREMAGHAMRTEIGAVGAMLYYPDNTIQHAGVILGIGGVAGHMYGGHPRDYIGQMGRAQLTQSLSAVTAACLLIRRSVFEEAGGLDESLRVAFNDVDFCLRVRQLGYRNLWTPLAELYHHESATRGYEDSPEKLARFASETSFMMERWADELMWDPAYSCNLTLTGTPFDLSFPPRDWM